MYDPDIYHQYFKDPLSLIKNINTYWTVAYVC